MNRSVRFLGHSVHQMLVVFPAGLLLTVFLIDAATWVWPGHRLAALNDGLLPIGLAAAVVAAPFGYLDWRQLPAASRARRVGAWHGLGNTVAVLLFLVSWLLRSEGVPPPWFALLPSLAAGGLMLVTAWLGGELVSRLGVGVYEDAHVNASSSLTASEATPSPDVPGHIGQEHPLKPADRAVRAPASSQPISDRRHIPNAPASAPDLSVAGEEDPGAAIDTTDMAPRGKRGSGPRGRRR
ncbi:MAG: DUF2231 domain-containing protein [Hydrogenophaga sp.]|jgi:uncharacterized membrane protein|nr:DUF2231 domain-containing protein [Hydrogenophaga sp.]